MSSDCGTGVNLANYTKNCFLDTNTDRHLGGFTASTVHILLRVTTTTALWQFFNSDTNVQTPQQQTTRRLDTQLSELPKHRKRQEKNEANVKCGHKLVKSDLPGQCPHLLDETGDSSVTLRCIQRVQAVWTKMNSPPSAVDYQLKQFFLLDVQCNYLVMANGA